MGLEDLLFVALLGVKPPFADTCSFLMLHRNVVRVCIVRVYELAWRLRIGASAALALVQAEGEYVTSHLSQVAQPVAERIIAAPPAPTHPEHADADPGYIDWDSVRRSRLELQPGRPRPSHKRHGPARPTRRLPLQSQETCWIHSPPCECQYQEEITTRDAAAIFRVKPATIRQWVHKGYLQPSGRDGASNTFLLADVKRAAQAISTRRRGSGVSASQRGQFIRTTRLPHRYDDRLLSVPESAALLGLSPSTIRSWIHRRVLIPAASSRPRAIQIRQGDLITAAQRSGSPRPKRT